MGLTKHLFCRIGWMENYQGQDDGEELIGGGDEDDAGAGNGEAGKDETGGAGKNDDALREEIWNGKLDGETIELKEDDEEE